MITRRTAAIAARGDTQTTITATRPIAVAARATVTASWIARAPSLRLQASPECADPRDDDYAVDRRHRSSVRASGTGGPPVANAVAAVGRDLAVPAPGVRALHAGDIRQAATTRPHRRSGPHHQDRVDGAKVGIQHDLIGVRRPAPGTERRAIGRALECVPKTTSCRRRRRRRRIARRASPRRARRAGSHHDATVDNGPAHEPGDRAGRADGGLVGVLRHARPLGPGGDEGHGRGWSGSMPHSSLADAPQAAGRLALLRRSACAPLASRAGRSDRTRPRARGRPPRRRSCAPPSPARRRTASASSPSGTRPTVPRMLSPKRVLAGPGLTALAVTPECSRRRASSRVNSTLRELRAVVGREEAVTSLALEIGEVEPAAVRLRRNRDDAAGGRGDQLPSSRCVSRNGAR